MCRSFESLNFILQTFFRWEFKLSNQGQKGQLNCKWFVWSVYAVDFQTCSVSVVPQTIVFVLFFSLVCITGLHCSPEKKCCCWQWLTFRQPERIEVIFRVVWIAGCYWLLRLKSVIGPFPAVHWQTSVIFVCSVEKSSVSAGRCWHRFSGVYSKLVVCTAGNTFDRVPVNSVIIV